jgi:hypothetical protein
MEPQGSSGCLHIIEYLNADFVGTFVIYGYTRVINFLLP